MRYVDRRRLWIVIGFAALFGAALPYVAVALNGTGAISESGPKPTVKHAVWAAHHRSNTVRDVVTIYRSTWDAASEDRAGMEAACRVPWPHELAETSENWYSSEVSRFGWPFRAAYMVIYVGPKGGFVPASTAWKVPPIESAWLDNRVPEYFPGGVVWTGVLGNITISVLLLGGLYCGLAHVRARRRIRRGMCHTCGYMSNRAAVCPECGTTP